jgi:hypothetical protein
MQLSGPNSVSLKPVNFLMRPSGGDRWTLPYYGFFTTFGNSPAV